MDQSSPSVVTASPELSPIVCTSAILKWMQLLIFLILSLLYLKKKKNIICCYELPFKCHTQPWLSMHYQQQTLRGIYLLHLWERCMRGWLESPSSSSPLGRAVVRCQPSWSVCPVLRAGLGSGTSASGQKPPHLNLNPLEDQPRRTLW